MFKYKDKYCITQDEQDKGTVLIYAIVDKKNSKLKKRIHKINKKFIVDKMMQNI